METIKSNFQTCSTILTKNTNMKIPLPGFLIVLFFFSSCCRKDSTETARYALSQEELLMIPYEQGQKISFKHSGGYAFDFSVTEDRLEWRQFFEFCEWNCCGEDYFSYQTRNTVLESAYPNLRITLSLGGTSYSEYVPLVLTLDINSRHSLSMPYDTSYRFICDPWTKAVFYDTLMVNDKLYTGVLMKPFDIHSFITDSTVLIPASVLYNYQGLIQITMTNDETYMLND